ncbi:MAG: hypothetical protein RR051_01625, partial [Clostridiales bacterium]
MEGHGAAVFYLGNFGVNSAMITMVAITCFLTLISWLGTRNMQVRPKGLQNVLEKCVEMLDNFLSESMDKKLERKCFP